MKGHEHGVWVGRGGQELTVEMATAQGTWVEA
jgi:hypothetical protein